MGDETCPGGANRVAPRERKEPRARLLRESSKSCRCLDEPPADDWYHALVRLLKEPVFALSNKHKHRDENGFRFEEPNRTFKLSVTTRDPAVGFAQILDGDILIFAASKLVHAHDTTARHGVAALNPTIEFCPYELLAILRRPVPEKTGGKTLNNLEDALKRLKATHVSLDNGSFHTDREFTLLEDYHRGRYPAAGERHPRWSLTVDSWMLEEIAARDLARVVDFNPANFGLASPDVEGASSLEQLVARWAVGYRQYRPGSAVAIKLMRAYKLSGMLGTGRFLTALDKVVTDNRLPDHTLAYANLERTGGGDLIIDLRPGKERERPRWRKKPPTTSLRAYQHAMPPSGDGLPDDIAGDV